MLIGLLLSVTYCQPDKIGRKAVPSPLLWSSSTALLPLLLEATKAESMGEPALGVLPWPNTLFAVGEEVGACEKSSWRLVGALCFWAAPPQSFKMFCRPNLIDPWYFVPQSTMSS